MWISWLGGVADNNPWRAASPRSRPLLPHTRRTQCDRSNKGAKTTIKRASQKRGSWHWVSSSLSRERKIKKFRWMKLIWRFLRTWKTAKSENSRKFIFNNPHEWRWKTAETITFRYDCLQRLDVGRLLLDFPTPRLTNSRKMRRIQRNTSSKIFALRNSGFKNVFGNS